MKNSGQILGRGMSFPPRVGPDGRMRWSEGETNVRESIAIILKTEAGERIQLADFGAGLGRWEPRIALDGVDVTPDPTDATAALATIAYRLVATGAAERTSVSIPLGRS